MESVMARRIMGRSEEKRALYWNSQGHSDSEKHQQSGMKKIELDSMYKTIAPVKP